MIVLRSAQPEEGVLSYVIHSTGYLLDEAHRAFAFTGAGISTASGIPDFRGPQGLWKKWQPVYYDEFMNSHEARVRHWEFKLQGWDEFS